MELSQSHATPFKDVSAKVLNKRRESSTSSTEEMDSMETSEQRLMEEIFRDEARQWLAIHGKQFFGVEAQKFLALEKRRKDLKGRSR